MDSERKAAMSVVTESERIKSKEELLEYVKQLHELMDTWAPRSWYGKDLELVNRLEWLIRGVLWPLRNGATGRYVFEFMGRTYEKTIMSSRAYAKYLRRGLKKSA